MRILRRLLYVVLASVTIALLSEAAYRIKLAFDAPSQGATGSGFEIYGVGESTLVGEPFDPKISVPRLLEHMFAGQIAGRPIVIKNLAQRGEPLYPQAIAFEHAVTSRDRHAPGVALIMSGHNEGITADAQDSSLPGIFTEQSVLLRDIVLALRRRHIIGRDKSLATHEYYLRYVIERAQQAGLVPILATMASNISRIEPNDGGAEGDVIAAIVKQGIELEEHGRYADARTLYIESLAAHQQSPASLYYRAGRCEEALGNFAAAREDYWNAVDRDPRSMFGRATRPQNELIRHLAREYHVPLVDTVQIFEAHSPHGILGDDLFMDGQHPTIEGYRLLANAYAEIVREQFDTPIAVPLHDARETADALGFGPEDFPGAIVDAGSWLITTSVGHPFPRDRMALAAKRFASLVGKGDDFSAWLGIALTQAATRGGLLRNPRDVPAVVGYCRSLRVEPADLSPLLAKLQQFGADDDVINRLRELGPIASPHPEG